MSKVKRIGLAGAGLTCAVIARELSQAGHECVLFETRGHIGGNCYTERDGATGVMLHVYGPHIFHTDDEEVWAYVRRYADFEPYVNRVKAITGGQVFSLPINLLTINQFFGQTLSPSQARAFIERQADTSIVEPRTFEDQALRFVGRDLYEAFFKHYTVKQWGVDPTDLPSDILKRLPVRFNYDDNYFAHRFQGMPRNGYTDMIANLLDHPAIEVRLNQGLEPHAVTDFEHVFWSGPLDKFFDHELGRLPYRTLDFEKFEADADYQGCAVLNYCDASVPYTRITEHKHFSPWESHVRTVCYREYSRACEASDVPYYPVHLAAGNERLEAYRAAAAKVEGVTFVGRLGLYKYMDMDVCIRSALDTVRAYLGALSGN